MSQSFPTSKLNVKSPGKESQDSYVDYFYDKPGTSPGTLKINEEANPPKIILINYNSEKELKKELNNPEECSAYITDDTVSWIDIQSLGSEEVLNKIGQLFNLHPLMLEDVVNVPQRPKVEEYQKQLLIITQMVRVSENKDGEFAREQVSFILGKNYLLTFQEEGDYDSFDPVRERIKTNKGTIRKRRADYLAYALIDSIIDSFFPVLENYGEQIEELETEVVIKPTRRTLEKIHYLKRELLGLRRQIWPMRDTINSLIRDENDLIGTDIRIYFRDCYDHTVQLLDMLETYRELAYSLMDVYMSSVGNKMNDIMKLLTVISTIFIPLTFLAGVYGMNFNTDVSPFNMPELNWYWGYPAFWIVMILIASGLIYLFWSSGWFEKFSSLKDE